MASFYRVFKRPGPNPFDELSDELLEGVRILNQDKINHHINITIILSDIETFKNKEDGGQECHDMMKERINEIKKNTRAFKNRNEQTDFINKLESALNKFDEDLDLHAKPRPRIK